MPIVYKQGTKQPNNVIHTYWMMEHDKTLKVQIHLILANRMSSLANAHILLEKETKAVEDATCFSLRPILLGCFPLERYKNDYSGLGGVMPGLRPLYDQVHSMNSQRQSA